MDVEVRALDGDEWQLKRDLRLTALKDSPDAFASSYAREAHRSETDWRTWPAGGAFFTAFSSIVEAPPANASDVSSRRLGHVGRLGLDEVGQVGHDLRPGPDDLGHDRRPGPGELGHDLRLGSDAFGRDGRLGFGDVGRGGDLGHGGSAEPLGIAGTWVAAAEPRTTHLISMWVAPVARGCGVAALLVDAVVGWARDHGHDTVELEVARGNTPAMTAYLRCGFTATQREPFTTGGTVLIRPV